VAEVRGWVIGQWEFRSTDVPFQSQGNILHCLKEQTQCT